MGTTVALCTSGVRRLVDLVLFATAGTRRRRKMLYSLRETPMFGMVACDGTRIVDRN